MLGPLQDNGGPTMTMALLPGSPAIDAGIAVPASPPTSAASAGRSPARPTSAPSSRRLDHESHRGQRRSRPALQRHHGRRDVQPVDQHPDADRQTGPSASAVQLFGASQIPLEATRYHYDRDTFTLTIDLRLTDSQKTMLEDGRYQLRIDTSQVYALGNPSNPLVDNDGTRTGVTARFHQLVGDFNGDGVVTVGDRTDCCSTTAPNSARASTTTAYDLNGDGIINLFDYMAWLKRLGRTV